MQKNEMLIKRMLMVVCSIVVIIVLCMNYDEKESKPSFSKLGTVEIYNKNGLLKRMEIDDIRKFMDELNLENSEVISDKNDNVPNYIIKVYNKTKQIFNKQEEELISVNVYDDSEVVELSSSSVAYKTQNDLLGNLKTKYDLIELEMPTYEPKYGNMKMVELAAQQLGNVGGEKFWSWYEHYNNVGFYRRMEWCCVFISWLGYQTGYLQAGEIPMFPNVSTGVAFYRNRGKWQGKHYVPSPGDVIFFDLMLDDRAYHVGLVEKVENGRVYTIEGNYNDMCARRSYPIGSPYIYGYGTPDYRVKLPDYLK